MNTKAFAVAAAILAGAAFIPQTASAAALPAATGPQQAASENPLLQQVGHRHRHFHHHHFRPRVVGRCWKWRNLCGDRWGWGTWQQRRCLRRHGC
jgi:hypothetical protein